jgi:hypothetical protein
MQNVTTTTSQNITTGSFDITLFVAAQPAAKKSLCMQFMAQSQTAEHQAQVEKEVAAHATTIALNKICLGNGGTNTENNGGL